MEIAYPGNVGAMEMVKFYRVATPDQKQLFRTLVQQQRSSQAWKLVQDTVGTKLQGQNFQVTETDSGLEDTNWDHLPSVEQARAAIPQILVRAQQEYDRWDENDIDTYAGGGICHLIADAVCDVLSDVGINCTSVSCSYEQHVYVAAQFREGVYTIDIPYHVYETGGGFSWKKIPGVKFMARDVTFYRVSGDPSEFDNYIDS